MERRRVGTSGLELPVVGMGTWKTFDVRAPHEVAQRREVVDVAIQHGSNLFDSSPMYGAAQEVLGVALKGRRDQALVSVEHARENTEAGEPPWLGAAERAYVARLAEQL